MNTTCNPCADPDGQGNALAAPRRNRYYYGKLLDVSHMAMEQDYGKKKRWLMNRLGLGSGVLCGLDVSAKDGKVCVSGGVAINTFGREIIVPGTYCIDPWALPDHCGDPVKALSRDEPHVVQLRVCYRECLTDEAPVQVSDCNSSCACEAGTVVESFQFEIVEGLPERPSSEVCDLMHLNAEELAKIPPADIPAFIRERLCQQLPHPCAGDAQCCVLLALVELLPGGRIGTVQPCAARTVLYSNEMLFEMILCLAARIEQCCGGGEPPPPPPPPDLRVAGVRILGAQGLEVATFKDPKSVATVAKGARAVSIEVSFTADVEPTTVVTGDYNPPGDPDSFSFLVKGGGRYIHGYVPGKLAYPASKLVRFDIAPISTEASYFLPGEYALVLFGNPDASPKPPRPAIATPGITPVPLDGEVTAAFPSGDGTPGGVFECRFVVQ
jgi:hypothetical protein